MADWGLIAIRFALYADLMLLVGLAAFPLYSLTLEERETQGPIHQFARWLRWVAPGGLVVLRPYRQACSVSVCLSLTAKCQSQWSPIPLWA